MRTNVYVDGFNLYYRAVKSTPYKWLDLSKLCQTLLPRHEVNRIRYFTALVSPRVNDLHAPIRQQTYIRALKTIPYLTVHYGQFRTWIKRMPLAAPGPEAAAIVDVWDTKEKGSDVNLATYLLIDGFQRDYEQAVVVSNDSDLALPIKMVRDQLGLPVGIVNPNLDQWEPTPKELKEAATFERRLREKTLKSSQFPTTLADANGTVHKPDSW